MHMCAPAKNKGTCQVFSIIALSLWDKCLTGSVARMAVGKAQRLPQPLPSTVLGSQVPGYAGDLTSSPQACTASTYISWGIALVPSFFFIKTVQLLIYWLGKIALIQGRGHSKVMAYTNTQSFWPTTNLIFFSRVFLKRMIFDFSVTSGVNFKLTFLEVSVPCHIKGGL